MKVCWTVHVYLAVRHLFQTPCWACHHVGRVTDRWGPCSWEVHDGYGDFGSEAGINVSSADLWWRSGFNFLSRSLISSSLPKSSTTKCFSSNPEKKKVGGVWAELPVVSAIKQTAACDHITTITTTSLPASVGWTRRFGQEVDFLTFNVHKSLSNCLTQGNQWGNLKATDRATWDTDHISVHSLSQVQLRAQRKSQ